MRHHALNIRRPAHTKPPRVARAPSLRSLALCTLTLCALALTCCAPAAAHASPSCDELARTGSSLWLSGAKLDDVIAAGLKKGLTYAKDNSIETPAALQASVNNYVRLELAQDLLNQVSHSLQLEGCRAPSAQELAPSMFLVEGEYALTPLHSGVVVGVSSGVVASGVSAAGVAAYAILTAGALSTALAGGAAAVGFAAVVPSATLMAIAAVGGVVGMSAWYYWNKSSRQAQADQYKSGVLRALSERVRSGVLARELAEPIRRGM